MLSMPTRAPLMATSQSKRRKRTGSRADVEQRCTAADSAGVSSAEQRRGVTPREPAAGDGCATLTALPHRFSRSSIGVLPSSQSRIAQNEQASASRDQKEAQVRVVSKLCGSHEM